MSEIKEKVVLIYRRTHHDDPDANGVFGCEDCMKGVRNYEYDAVIGIGGKKPWPGSEEIAYKINWVGIGPTKHDPSLYTERKFIGPWVTFSKFLLLNKDGPFVSEVAPKLHEYMFDHGCIPHFGYIPRFGKSFPPDLYQEVLEILSLADNAPPSKSISAATEAKKSSPPSVIAPRGCK